MEYQNKSVRLESKRIQHILQHKQWLEEPHETPLDLTNLTNDTPSVLPSWFSQLDDNERQMLTDRLAHLELIFWHSGEEAVDEILTNKNSQIINENYEKVIKNRRLPKDMPRAFEKIAA